MVFKIVACNYVNYPSHAPSCKVLSPCKEKTCNLDGKIYMLGSGVTRETESRVMNQLARDTDLECCQRKARILQPARYVIRLLDTQIIEQMNKQLVTLLQTSKYI